MAIQITVLSRLTKSYKWPTIIYCIVVILDRHYKSLCFVMSFVECFKDWPLEHSQWSVIRLPLTRAKSAVLRSDPNSIDVLFQKVARQAEAIVPTTRTE